MDKNSHAFSSNDFGFCKTQSCSCDRCKRTRKFQQMLSRLTAASKMINYEEEISVIVAMILDVYIRFY